jgi:hypothetical protein
MTNKIPITISEKLIALNARLSMDDIDVIYEAVDRIEQLEAELHEAYEDCINAVNKIKTDALTVAAVHHKIAYTKTLTAEDFMVAIAEDIEREIKLRAALRGGGK